MKAAALRGALSDRARADRVHVVESFVGGDRPSTKSAIAALSGLTSTERQSRRSPRILVVLERGDDLTWLSLRNVDTVHLLAVDQLNTYDVLLCDDVVFTKGAYDAFVGRREAGSEPAQPAEAKSTEPEAAEPEATEPEAAEPESAEADTAEPDTAEAATEPESDESSEEEAK